MKKVLIGLMILSCAVFAVSCAKKQGQIKDASPAKLEYREAVKATLLEVRLVRQGFSDEKTYAVRETNEFLPLEDDVLFTQADISSADLAFDEYGSPSVIVKLKDSASAKFSDLTGANIGRRLGISVNGEVITAPQIREKITDGKFVIKGSLTKIEAESIQKSLVK